MPTQFLKFALLVSLFLPAVGQAQRFVQPLEVRGKISPANLQILAAEQSGETDGGKFAQATGFDFGKNTAGRHANFGNAFLQKLAELRRSHRQMDMIYLPLIERYFDRPTGKTHRDTLLQDFFWAGFQQGFASQKTDGAMQAQLDFDWQTSGRARQFMHFPKKLDAPLTLDFRPIADLFCRERAVSQSEFSEILLEVERQCLRYLCRVFARDGSLDFHEQTLIFDYLDRLHARAVPLYFQKFEKLVAEKTPASGGDFLNYDCQNRMAAFVEVASEAVSALADAGFSLAKGTCSLANSESFRAMGRIAEVFSAGILSQFQDLPNKIAVLPHLDQNRCLIEKKLKKILANIVVETRQTKKNVHSRDLGSGNLDLLDARVHLEAIAQLGIQTEKIRVEISHPTRQVKVFISRQPQFLKELHRGHHLLGDLTKYKASCSSKQMRARAAVNFSRKISDADLTALFAQRLPATQNLPMCHRPLRRAALRRVVAPVVLELVAPLLAGACNDYRYQIVFGK